MTATRTATITVDAHYRMVWLLKPNGWQPLAVIGWRARVGPVRIFGLSFGLSFLSPERSLDFHASFSWDKRIRHLNQISVKVHGRLPR